MPKEQVFSGAHITRHPIGGRPAEYCESSYSVSKQTFLHEYVQNHGSTVPPGGVYTFVDCHGGVGNWRDKRTMQFCNGSPIVFYKTLQTMGVPYRGLVFEIREDRCEQLRSNLYYEQENIFIYNEDNRNAPARLLELMREEQRKVDSETLSDPYMFGTIYYDYTGWPRVSEIASVAEVSSMDLLIHFSTSYWKMLTEEKKAARPDNRIFQNLDEFNRRYWYVSDPTRGVNNKFNFTFLHGSNTHDQSITTQLVPVESDEGQRRLIVAQYTKQQRQKNNL